MGSIVKQKTGKFRAYYRSKKLSSKQVSKVFETHTEAQLWLDEMSDKVENREEIFQGNRDYTVQELHDEYMQSPRYKSLRDSTRSDKSLHSFYLDEFASTKVKYITQTHARQFLDKLINSTTRSGKQIASATAANRYNAARALFTWALSTGRILYNPFSYIPDMPRRASRVVRVPGPLQLAIFEVLQSLPYDRFKRPGLMHYVFYLLFFHCAFRPSELASLRWSNVDFENRTLTIPQHKTEKRTGTPLVKKVPADVWIKFLEYYRWSDANNHAQLDSLVFFTYSPSGKQKKLYQHRTAWLNIVRLLPENSLKFNSKKITPYALRHEFVSSAIANKHNPITISKILGHTGTQTIERHYLHNDSSSVFEDIESLYRNNNAEVLNQAINLTMRNDPQSKLLLSALKKAGVSEKTLDGLVSRALKAIDDAN